MKSYKSKLEHLTVAKQNKQTKNRKKSEYCNNPSDKGQYGSRFVYNQKDNLKPKQIVKKTKQNKTKQKRNKTKTKNKPLRCTCTLSLESGLISYFI